MEQISCYQFQSFIIKARQKKISNNRIIVVDALKMLHLERSCIIDVFTVDSGPDLASFIVHSVEFLLELLVSVVRLKKSQFFSGYYCRGCALRL